MEEKGSARWTDPKSHKSLWTPGDFLGWDTVVFPDFHEVLGIGAFFAYLTPDLDRARARLAAALFPGS